MPEDTNDNLYIYFTNKDSFDRLLLIAANGIQFNLNNKVTNWTSFGENNMKFVYCIDNKLIVTSYDEDKITKAEFILVHDSYNGIFEIKKPFVFFCHSQTDQNTVGKLKQNPNWRSNVPDSHNEKELNGVITPYYNLANDIFNYFNIE